ncbi:hypothetical protein GN244_ATG20801 [Phytophthora infestans]|uniref:BED-type domain-containing protein n=1 Tax=Phytophthora infestans TaxID=4787 RepID=A0A833S5I8_PHYIN|nr:hypothetical protein GN244_ATG20801 [Phytophthora infestans]
MPFTASTKDVVHPLFKQQDATSWKCKLCSKIFTQPLGKGYTNLLDHFLRKLGVKATDELSEKASKPVFSYQQNEKRMNGSNELSRRTAT